MRQQLYKFPWLLKNEILVWWAWTSLVTLLLTSVLLLRKNIHSFDLESISADIFYVIRKFVVGYEFSAWQLKAFKQILLDLKKIC